VALRKNAKLELLKGVPLFAHCSRKELEEVGKIADELDFLEGKELTREGSRGREFFVLLEGTAEVTQGKRRIASLSDGDFFGEIALVSDVPRTATVTTVSPVRALVITDRSFKRLLERFPQVQLKVLRALAERIEPQVP
jgi:CRP/FNR family transcriptional regulator, cyclic AMP receptor protein